MSATRPSITQSLSPSLPSAAKGRRVISTLPLCEQSFRDSDSGDTAAVNTMKNPSAAVYKKRSSTSLSPPPPPSKTQAWKRARRMRRAGDPSVGDTGVPRLSGIDPGRIIARPLTSRLFIPCLPDTANDGDIDSDEDQFGPEIPPSISRLKPTTALLPVCRPFAVRPTDVAPDQAKANPASPTSIMDHPSRERVYMDIPAFDLF